MKVAFIGPKQYSGSLKVIGFDSFEADSAEEVSKLIENLKNRDYGVIFTSSDIFKKDVEGVVVLPGLKKIESNFLKNIIKKAIGKEIKI